MMKRSSLIRSKSPSVFYKKEELQVDNGAAKEEADMEAHEISQNFLKRSNKRKRELSANGSRSSKPRQSLNIHKKVADKS